MKKIILVLIGVLLISAGTIDLLIGVLMPHSRVLIVAGAVVVAVAGFLHQWQKLQRRGKSLFSALAAAPLTIEDVLTPSEGPWPVLQWNPTAVTGGEFWLIVLAIAVAIFAFWAAINNQPARNRYHFPLKSTSRLGDSGGFLCGRRERE